jgi:segregation and condensation protein B
MMAKEAGPKKAAPIKEAGSAQEAALAKKAAPAKEAEPGKEAVPVKEAASGKEAAPAETTNPAHESAAKKAVSVSVKTRLVKEAALLEAILYLETDPMDLPTLARISGLSKDALAKAAETLEEKYSKEDSGVELLRIGGGYMLSAKQEYWDTLKPHYGKKNEIRFSRATLETLSIIAYSQPVTRSEIESIRGVQTVDTVMRLLLEKTLIKEVGKKDVPGKPTQYGTTKEFLRCFRLDSIADLPKLSETEAARFELES